MKARVKATGDIVDATYQHTAGDGVKYYDIDKSGYVMMEDELDFDFSYDDPDYWTRLEHQAAIAAMQGMLTNPKLCEIETPISLASTASTIANALVEKYKKEERK